MAIPAGAQTVVTDPVPTVQSSGVVAWVRDFATPPRSSTTRPYARINQLEPFSRAKGWLGVNDLRGQLYLVDYQGNVKEYLNLRTRFAAFRDTPGLGTGFASFAVHPEFEQNGIFYTAHSEAGGSGTPTIPLPTPVTASLQGVIIEWTAADPAADMFAGTWREVLRIDLTGTIHGFQEIAFRPGIAPGHPDYGMLYICVGEAQTLQRGPLSNIGTATSPLGTLLRIDPRGANGPGGRYGIPADNPFVGVPGAVAEIWAYGFRNPHRIDWNDATGALYLTDIGEQQVEELNLIEPGRNYGWPNREGAYLFNPAGDTSKVYTLPPGDTGYTYPVAMYDHADGTSIAGGSVYRGSRIAGLDGAFLASDIQTGRLWMTAADSLAQGAVQPFLKWNIRNEAGIIDLYQMVGTTARTDMRLGKDHFGELYILTKQDGKIRKLVNAGEPRAGYGMLEGYPWRDFWIDSGQLLGWAEVSAYPWVYSSALGKYVYLAHSSSPGGWIYVPRGP